MANHLGEFEQLILFAVLRLGEEAFGVRIRQDIETRTDRTVAAGAIYTALGRMEARGLVASRTGDSNERRAGRRRKYWSLEPRGAEVLHRSFSAVTEMASGLVPELEALATGAGGEPR